MSKSHVSMAQRICVVTGEKFDTGEILLDKRLRNSLERNTVTGWGISPEVQEKLDDGFVAVVGVNREKSTKEDDGSITPAGAYRTGHIGYVKKDVLENMTGQKYERGVTFADETFMEYLEQLYNESQKEE